MEDGSDDARRCGADRRTILQGTAGVTGGLLFGAAATGSAAAESCDLPADVVEPATKSTIEGSANENDDPTADIPERATVVDVTEEPSIDADGDLGAEIQAYCNSLSRVEHAFVVPEGTYTWNTQLNVPGSAFFGLVGDGRPTFEVRDFLDFHVQIARPGNGIDDLLLQNYVVDIDGTDRYGNEIDAGVCNAFATDGALIEDVELAGARQRYHEDERVGGDPAGDYYVVGRAYTVRLDMVAADGEGVVRNVSLPDGAVHTYESEAQNLPYGEGIAFCSEAYHRGTIRWEDCYAEEYLGNSFYMWSNETTGTNVLEGCEVVNGYRTALRLGRNDEAYDCTVTYDEFGDGYHENTARSGLWLGEADSIAEGRLPYAENVRIVSSDSRGNLLRADEHTDGGRIVGVEVESSGDSGAAILSSFSGDESTRHPVAIENFSVSETSSDGAYYALRVDRPGLTFRDGSFAFDGTNNGIRVRSPGATFESVDIDVANGETGLRLDSGDVELADVRLEGRQDAPATLILGPDFDLGSATLRDNSFQYVDLVDKSGRGVTLADLEG